MPRNSGISPAEEQITPWNFSSICRCRKQSRRRYLPSLLRRRRMKNDNGGQRSDNRGLRMENGELRIEDGEWRILILVNLSAEICVKSAKICEKYLYEYLFHGKVRREK